MREVVGRAVAGVLGFRIERCGFCGEDTIVHAFEDDRASDPRCPVCDQRLGGASE